MVLTIVANWIVISAAIAMGWTLIGRRLNREPGPMAVPRPAWQHAHPSQRHFRGPEAGESRLLIEVDGKRGRRR